MFYIIGVLLIYFTIGAIVWFSADAGDVKIGWRGLVCWPVTIVKGVVWYYKRVNMIVDLILDIMNGEGFG